MIIIKLKGGLGNQMFQYAFAKSISLKLSTKLFVDLTSLSNEVKIDNLTHRNYQLNRFNINDNVLTFEQSKDFEKKVFLNNKFRLSSINKYFFKNKLPIFSKHIDYLPGYRNFDLFIKNFLIIEGYFQSEKYFFSNNLIKHIFQLDASFLNNNTIALEVMNRILNTESVGVHIRRGDYVSNNLINSIHGTCSIEYYNKAFHFFKNKNTVFYCFSDDINWVKTWFKDLDNNFFIRYVDCTNDNFEDLFLMSSCKHNIIANSSFSWWSAWLNQNTNKIIICPKQWYNNNDLNNLNTEMIPKNWIKI
jgi:hypothetical protein